MKNIKEVLDEKMEKTITAALIKVLSQFGIDTEFPNQEHTKDASLWKLESSEIKSNPRIFNKLVLTCDCFLEEEIDENVVSIIANLDWRWSTFSGGFNGTRFISIKFYYYHSMDRVVCTEINPHMNF